MQFPIDRRSAFGGIAGAALTYGIARPEIGRSGRDANRPVAPPTGIAAKLDERPSVRDKGAKGDGVAMDGAAIQDALQSFATVWIPGGTYMIDVPLIVPSYRTIIFAADAIFYPAHDGITLFGTGEVSYASRIVAPRIDARGKRNVTAFDLQGFRHSAEIQHADILGCARGIVLRELCWDTLIYMPWIRQTAQPIIIANGSNAVDIIHPGIDGFDVGIGLSTGPQHTTTTARIWGGYVQNGRVGIVDEGCFGTIIDGTYFEGVEDADIALVHSVRSNISRTQHYSEKGRSAIRMTGADGVTVIDPLMTSGARSVGLYDIDATSRNVTRLESVTDGGVNQPLGNIAGSGALVREQAGAFKPILAIKSGGTVRYERQEGRWRRAGGQLSVAIDLHWSGVQAGGQIAIAGLPAFALPSAQSLATPVPAIVQGVASGQVFARLDRDGTVRITAVDGGQEKPVAIAAIGSVSVMVSCLF